MVRVLRDVYFDIALFLREPESGATHPGMRKICRVFVP